MTPQEMHIGIDFLLQKVNSNITKTFRPEEKDWALNEEVLRFIKQRISSLSNNKKQGLEEDQKRYDDIRALITNTGINGIPALPIFPRDNDSVFSYLPANYFSLINDRSLTYNLCGASYSSKITTTPFNFYTTCLPVLNDINLYTIFKVDLGGIQIFDLANYYPSGLPSSSSKFMIVNLLLDTLNNINGVSARYEYYYDTYCPSSIVIVTTSPLNPSISVEYTAGIQGYTSTLKTLSQINTTSPVNQVPNRLSKTEDIYQLLNSNFCTTLFDSPLSVLEGGKICVFHKQNFILSNINISYIRKPKKINLSLNIGCELSESVHQEIVDNTAKRLAGITKSEDYPEIVNENLLKE